MTRLSLVLALLLAACAGAPPPAAPATDSAEFQIETTVLAAYNVVSGPAGRRDWNRFKELFVPSAHLIEKGVAWTPDEYSKQANDALQTTGLFEHPTATRIERSGDIAQVWSRYESRHAANEEKPFAHGVRSFQLIRSGDRWLIASVLMQPE